MPMTQAERDAEDARALQAKIDALPSHLSAYRYQREISGYEHTDGYIYHTDRLSRATWNEMRREAEAASSDDTVIEPFYKAVNGVVTNLTAAQIIAIHNGGKQHIRKCFIAEASVLANIGDYTTEAEIETAFEAAYDAA